mmetsp:Transcript_75942/g.222604  ORF Transcript_75942/g.222604 Transcript_75942/m.222604 type:complete len:376 (+) Transcript_75942:1325-2452(+)
MEDLACGVDLLLTSEEHQDIARGLRQVNLQHCHKCRLDVVLLGVLGVEDLHGERPAWNCENVGVEEVAGELLGIQRCRGHNQLQLRPDFHRLLQEAEQNVSGDGPLVCLVQHDDGVLGHVGVGEHLSEQHAIGLVLDQRLRACLILEPNGISHLLPQAATELFSDALRYGHGRHSSRLGAANHATGRVTGLSEILCDLRRLATARLTDHDQHLVVVDGLQKLVPELEDGQALALLLDGPRRLLPKGHGLADVELLPLGQLVLALPQAAQGLRDGSLAGLGPGVLPRPVHVLGDGIQQALLHGLARLAALLGQGDLRRGGAGQAAVRLPHHLDRGELHAGLGRLAAQEDGLLLLHLDLKVLFHVALRQQAVLLITI